MEIVKGFFSRENREQQASQRRQRKEIKARMQQQLETMTAFMPPGGGFSSIHEYNPYSPDDDFNLYAYGDWGSGLKKQ